MRIPHAALASSLDPTSYSLWIGDHAVLLGSDPREATVRSPHAPRFEGDPHPRQNHHQSTRSDWHDFCRSTHLHDLLFAPGSGLMAEHPGTARLTRDHAGAVHDALVRFIAGHRRADPSFTSGRVEDAHFARLLWLDWWFYRAPHRWDEPAIHNR
ncbi:MAG: hypothetical protein ACRELB_09540 [Polyangiaceae bacterium]